MKSKKSDIPPQGEKKKRRIRMTRPADAIRILSSVVTGLVNDDLPIERSRAIIYACSVLPKLFEIAEFEERLKALEEKAK